MSSTVRIGNAHGFWGDRLEAAAEMLALEPALDYLTLDFLAEVSMSILAVQQQRYPTAGYARDFVDVVQSLAPYWRSGGKCRVVTNAGGLNPLACAKACQTILSEAGCADRTIAVVTGDDVLELIRADVARGNDIDLLRNLDTNESIEHFIDKLTTANVYLGAEAICEALSCGADLVITGRAADPSLTVGPCMYHFGWKADAWDQLAGATIAGHLIECGTQVTGGIFTDWLDVPNVNRIGFPIVEVAEDGRCVVTKPSGSGGIVTPATVKEQLLYEIGDPNCYLSPDVTVSFTSLRLDEESSDRVSVRAAKGRPAPDTLKISATWLAGYRAAGQLTIYGERAVAKARRAAEAVLDQLESDGVHLGQTHVDILGAQACAPFDSEEGDSLNEVGLRIAVADESRDAVEKFARSLMPLVTAGPQGTTGYSEGRPRVHAQFAFWPCLIDRDRVQTSVEVLPSLDAQELPTRSVSAEVAHTCSRAFTESANTVGKLPKQNPLSLGRVEPQRGEGRNQDPRNVRDFGSTPSPLDSSRPSRKRESEECATSKSVSEGAAEHGRFLAYASGFDFDTDTTATATVRQVRTPRLLGEIAHARSGDKGRHANIGIIARQPHFYDQLRSDVTAARVAKFLRIENHDRVDRFELPNLCALNFLIQNILENPLRLDAQGKTLGQLLLQMPLEQNPKE